MTRKTFAFLALLSAYLAHPAAADPISVANLATGTSDSALVAAQSNPNTLLFCGFASLETVGSAAATVQIYDGTDATGTLLYSWSLTANESRSEGPWPADACIPARSGIFVDRGGTGSVLLTVFYRTRFN